MFNKLKVKQIQIVVAVNLHLKLIIKVDQVFKVI
jgi:hypothetical protein